MGAAAERRLALSEAAAIASTLERARRGGRDVTSLAAQAARARASARASASSRASAERAAGLLSQAQARMQLEAAVIALEEFWSAHGGGQGGGDGDGAGSGSGTARVGEVIGGREGGVGGHGGFCAASRGSH